MNLFTNINIISVIIIFIFIMPILTGLLNPLSRNTIQHSLLSILNILKFIIGFTLTVYLGRFIFSDAENGFFSVLDRFFPSVRDVISYSHYDIVAYVIIMFIMMSIIFFVLGLITIPLHKHMMIPLAEWIASRCNTLNIHLKRLFSGLWQLPKSLWMVLVFSLLLNFYTTYINNPSAGEYINNSKAYQVVNKSVLRPILSADLVKQMPVMISDSFRKAAEDFTPANTDPNEEPNYWKLPAIKYFNGMTIDEAVKSNDEIDNTAKQIVGTEKNDKKKAYLLYKWVSENIQYDKGKAEIIVQNPSHVNSGSIVTFEERKGVCFDYSCLYISMCRAVGLNVRLISGLGFNGMEWGEHAWNQVYDPEEEIWLNVDTTFGNSGSNYFDNSDFSTSHRYDVIQAEW